MKKLKKKKNDAQKEGNLVGKTARVKSWHSNGHSDETDKSEKPRKNSHLSSPPLRRG